jgi:hypothetical protein
MLSILEILLRGNSRPSYSSIAMVKKPKTKSSMEKDSRERINQSIRTFNKNKPPKPEIRFVGTRKFKGITRK